MDKTVIDHVLSRLNDLGISDVFGVAGDYAFPIEDAVCNSDTLRWIGNCNELNASYAAEGYARIKGVAAIATTFGVGELSAINGIAGAFAENLAVFHLVGMPTTQVQKSKKIVHHTLGNGNFDVFYQMSQPVVCASAILTPENCVAETERLIACALRERRPVYMGIPSDSATMPIHKPTDISPPALPKSDKQTLDEAVAVIIDNVTKSERACILPGVLSSRLGLTKEVQAIIDRTGLPYATMFSDKSVLSESNPHYIGMYDGHLMNESVRNYVEGSDCVIRIGALMSDLNSGSFTADICRENQVAIMADHVQVGSAVYPDIYMKDVLLQLENRLPRCSHSGPKVKSLGRPIPSKSGKITSEYLYPRLEAMFKPDDIIIADTGDCSMGLAFALLPKNATFHNQTLWASIGWATAAALGIALAAPHRRLILVTGDGAHQLTAQEVSQFARFGLKPIILVLNNHGYLIERLLCGDPEAYYNDLAKWNYAQLPEALGCEGWFSKQVTSCDELDEALKTAGSLGSGAYIEIVTDKCDASLLARRMEENIDSLYSA